MKKLFLSAFVAMVAMFFVSCGSQPQGMGETAFSSEGVTASSDSEPLNLKILVNDIYCKQTACGCIHEVAAREYGELLEQLKNKFNINLELIYCMEVFYLEDSIKTQKYDGALCKPWNAVRFQEELALDYKRIADVIDIYDNQWLEGNIMVPKDSPIQTIEDLNGRTLVTGQEDAYEKYDQAMQLLKEKGIKPAKIYTKSSCLENMNELIDKYADAAVVSHYVMDATCAVDVANPDDYKVIEVTSKTPLTSVLLDMKKVSKEDALRLQNALLALSGENSPESMLSRGFVKPASWNPVRYVKQQ